MFYIMNYKQEFKIEIKNETNKEYEFKHGNPLSIHFKKQIDAIYKTNTTKNTLTKFFHDDIDCLINSIIHYFFSSNSQDTKKIIFSNSKIQFVILKKNTSFFINCFHMNTLTFKVFKTLIYELKFFFINYYKNEKNYKSIETVKPYTIFLFNFCNLEKEKQNVFYNVFSNSLINSIVFNLICFQRFYDNADDTFFYYSKNNPPKFIDTTCFLPKISTQQTIDTIFHVKNTKFKTIDEKNITLRSLIQTFICNTNHSNILLIEAYKKTFKEIDKEHGMKKLHLLIQLNKYFKESIKYLKITSTKHIIYENFICQCIDII